MSKALTLGLLAVSLSFASAPDTVNSAALPPPHAGIVASKLAAGFVLGYMLGTAGAIGGFLVGWAIDPPPEGTVLPNSLGIRIATLLGVTAGGSFGTASGTWLIGSACKQNGRFFPTWGWSALAAAAGVAMISTDPLMCSPPVANPATGNTLMVLGASVLLVGTPVIATWAYDRSRTTPRAPTDGRVMFGSPAIRARALPGGSIYPSFNLQFLTVRF